MILLILCQGLVDGAVMPNKVIGCQLRLRDFVEGQGELVLVSTLFALLLLDRWLFRVKFDSQDGPSDSFRLHQGRPGSQPPVPAVLAWDLFPIGVGLLGYCRHLP